MAIKQTQAPKSTTATKQSDDNVLTQEERELVDELAALEKKLAPIRPQLKRFDEVKKTLAAIALDAKRFDPEHVAVLRGFSGIAEFDVVSFSREIKDMHGLIGKMKSVAGGYEGILPLLKVNLGDVDKYLDKAEQTPYIGLSENGSRKIKSVRTKGE